MTLTMDTDVTTEKSKVFITTSFNRSLCFQDPWYVKGTTDTQKTQLWQYKWEVRHLLPLE